MAMLELEDRSIPLYNEVDFILMGKTGHGKSATGNSILNFKAFKTSANLTSETSGVHVDYAHIDGRKIKVVDVAGVSDTRISKKSGQFETAITNVSEAITRCTGGFHVLILVFKFQMRMTDEEMEVIHWLKHLLGDNVLKNHTIILFTCGDQYKAAVEEEEDVPPDFQDWCKLQEECFKNVFKECDYRTLLFNNKAKTKEERHSQRNKLFEVVDKMLLQNNGKRYTSDIFKKAEELRNKVLLELKKEPNFSEDIIRDVDLLLKLPQTDGRWQKVAFELLKLEGIPKLSELRSMVVDLVENKGPGDVPKIKLNNYFHKYMKPSSEKVHEKTVPLIKDEVEKIKCFPGISKVILSTGITIAMKDLQVGDKVLVKDGHGKLSYDSVYMFGHRESQVINDFIVLETLTNSVAVTSEHYVYCVKAGKEQCVAAKDVEVGDSLLVVTDDSLVIQPVQKISFNKMQGLFAPFTTSGTIVVDGALMSCYVNVLKNKTCHTLLWPVRHLYRLSPATLVLINGSGREGVPAWAKMSMKLMQLRHD